METGEEIRNRTTVLVSLYELDNLKSFSSSTLTFNIQYPVMPRESVYDRSRNYLVSSPAYWIVESFFCALCYK